MIKFCENSAPSIRNSISLLKLGENQMEDEKLSVTSRYKIIGQYKDTQDLESNALILPPKL